jgi:hypothetical protein
MEEKPIDLEILYQQYISDLGHWLPDGLIEVEVDLLHKYDLLHFHTKVPNDSALTRYFNVAESEEKLTLFNNEFVIWIIPESDEYESRTLTLIALNKPEGVQLEMAFLASGIYNRSYLVLRLLEKLLLEIHGTEDYITRLELSTN